jgi:hypothetical protein
VNRRDANPSAGPRDAQALVARIIESMRDLVRQAQPNIVAVGIEIAGSEPTLLIGQQTPLPKAATWEGPSASASRHAAIFPYGKISMPMRSTTAIVGSPIATSSSGTSSMLEVSCRHRSRPQHPKFRRAGR